MTYVAHPPFYHNQQLMRCSARTELYHSNLGVLDCGAVDDLGFLSSVITSENVTN